jgi:hypothetical protein
MLRQLRQCQFALKCRQCHLCLDYRCVNPRRSFAHLLLLLGGHPGRRQAGSQLTPLRSLQEQALAVRPNKPYPLAESKNLYYLRTYLQNVYVTGQRFQQWWRLILLVPKKDKREVLMFNLTLSAWPPSAKHDAKEIPISRLAEIWKKHAENDTAIVPENELFLSEESESEEIDASGGIPENEDASTKPNQIKSGSIIRIAKVDDQTEYVSLLFQCGDADGTRPAFIDPNTKIVRHISPEGDELIAYSAHLVIAKNAKRAGVYRAVLERMPTLGRSKVVSMLNRLVRQSCNDDPYQFTYENKKLETAAFRPIVHSLLQPSVTLKKALEHGILNYIELVKDQVVDTEMDEEDGVIEERQTLRLKIEPINVLARLKRLCAIGAEKGYQFAEISITQPKDTKPTTTKVPLHSDQTDISDWTFGNLVILSDFTVELEQCWSEIHLETRTKMISVLKKKALWKH